MNPNVRQASEVLEHYLQNPAPEKLESARTAFTILQALGLPSKQRPPIFERVQSLIDEMKQLPTSEARHAVMLEFCTSCGSLNPSCQCWNDD